MNDWNRLIEEETNNIVTTIEELNAFAIVKSILRKNVNPTRLVYRDTESYLGVLLDDNGRKWICRIEAGKRMNLILPDNEKKSIKYNLKSLDDIYYYSDQLIEVLNRYL